MAARRLAGTAHPSSGGRGSRAETPGWVEVGRVERPRGLEGALIVGLHGDDPANLLGAREVTLRGEPGRIPFQVRAARDLGQRSGRARVELELAGIRSRELARDWAGAAVSIRESDLRPLPEGELYWRDVVGLAVRCLDGRRLGTVQEIWPTAGHDVLVVATGAEPLLVPAAQEVIVRVDLAARELWIDPPDGLVPGQSAGKEAARSADRSDEGAR
jgi:16S rRNA processing protein RimM